MEGSSENGGKIMIKNKSVLESDLKILKVCKSRLSFSSGGEGNKINTPPRQALQIKYAKYGGGEEIAMQ